MPALHLNPATGHFDPPTTSAAGAAQATKAHYSFNELQNLWVNQGGNPGKSVIAAAIAMAESHGDANAQHLNSDGTIDRGLWQINSVHGAQSTFDPKANARAAIAISKNGTDFRPWTTFRNHAYIPFTKGQSPAFPSAGEVATDAAAAVTPEPLKDLASFISRAGVIFELDWWKRAGLVVGGFIAILLGVVWIGKEFMPKNLPIPPIIP